MKSPMYSNNAAKAVGFAGLRQYVGDIDEILTRCREAGDSTGGIDASLIAEIWDEEPQLQVQVRPHDAPQMFHHDVLSSNQANSRASKRSSMPAILSVAAIFSASVLTVGLMRYLGENQSIEPEVGSLQVSEAVPPVGRGLVLNPSQIRYCIAQGIRLGAASEQLSSLPEGAAQKLEAMYVDYDGRCAEYRFQAGAFDQARRDVEARRETLEQEGIALFSLSGEAASAALTGEKSEQEPRLQFVSGEAPVVEDVPVREVSGISDRSRVFSREPRKYIKDLQWRLYKLKYYHGPIDGVDSAETQQALRGFFSVHDKPANASDEKAVFSAVDKIYQSRR